MDEKSKIEQKVQHITSNKSYEIGIVYVWKLQALHTYQNYLLKLHFSISVLTCVANIKQVKVIFILLVKKPS